MMLFDSYRDLTADPFNPFNLVDCLDTAFPGVYDKHVGVWEDYTLGQHTLMVLGQFEKYFAGQSFHGCITHSHFRLFLAIHDMGKPEAVANGEKHNQSRYNLERFDRVYPGFPFIDGPEREVFRSLLTDDPVGRYLKHVMRRHVPRTEALDTCVDSIRKMHGQQQALPLKAYTDLLLTYFRCDAGSYTVDAGGLQSLDHLFDFSGGRIEFKGEARELIMDLTNAITAAC
jgi:hypothetical protein